VTAAAYRHHALFYAGVDDFIAQVGPFVAAGVEDDEPTLVVVDKVRIDALRESLGDAAAEVHFANMLDVGENPARIIAAWRAFVDGHRGRPVRGVGEPIYPERTPHELRECELHESLLNLAFGTNEPFWLVCPYNTVALPDDVLETAYRTHPHVQRDTTLQPSTRYEVIDLRAPFGMPLPPAPDDAEIVPFRDAELPVVRRAAEVAARRRQLRPARVDDFVIAINEIATNAIEHGGGAGTLRLWVADGNLVAEIADRGLIAEPLIGRLPPPVDLESRRGLWLANQLCDLVQIASSPGGTTVRLLVRLSTARHGANL
jgi:anti-sigma regulatory factor (Ser/Thr protein kinase)